LGNNFTKTIEKLLHEIFCEALKIDLKYEDFVSAIVSAYGFRPKKVVYAKLISKIETLIETMRIQPVKHLRSEIDSVDLLRNLISGRKEIVKAYLIDDLGLPEIYALAKSFGYPNLSLKVIVNEIGNTQTFKTIFGVNYMNELSRILGAQLITGQDRLVHEIFSRWVNYDELLRLMEKLLPTRLLEIIDAAPVIIIADHGYDVGHAGGYYRLCHGLECRKALLSMICPIILVSGQLS